MFFKNLFLVYPDAMDNFHLWGAIVLFAVFLVCVLIKKIASSESYASNLRRLHFKIFIPYLLTSFVCSLLDGKVNNYPLGSFIGGAFIYFSFLYVYLFSLVALAKKSISVNLMGQINEFTPDGECTEEKLIRQYLLEKKGLEYMRENGLDQLVKQGWAKDKGNTYQISDHGRRVNDFTNVLLKIFNLARY